MSVINNHVNCVLTTNLTNDLTNNLTNDLTNDLTNNLSNDLSNDLTHVSTSDIHIIISDNAATTNVCVDNHYKIQNKENNDHEIQNKKENSTNYTKKSILEEIFDNINNFIIDISRSINNGIVAIRSSELINSLIDTSNDIKNDITSELNIIDERYCKPLRELFVNTPVNTDNSSKYIELHINYYQDEHNYIYEIELPGVPIDTIFVVEQNGILYIRGQKQLKRFENLHNYIQINSITGCYNKVIQLPKDADMNFITGTSRDGLLSIIIKKMKNQQ